MNRIVTEMFDDKGCEVIGSTVCCKKRKKRIIFSFYFAKLIILCSFIAICDPVG